MLSKVAEPTFPLSSFRVADDLLARANITAARAKESYKTMTIEDGVEFELWFWRD